MRLMEAASREAVSYGAVAAGVFLAVVLIRWFPVIPVSAPSKPLMPPAPPAAAPAEQRLVDGMVGTEKRRFEPPVLQRKSAPPPRDESPPAPLRDESPPAARRAQKPPAAKIASPKPLPARAATPAPALPVEVPAPPPLAPMPKPVELQVPVVIPTLSRPVGLNAKIGDAAGFRTKLLAIGEKYSATITFQGSSVQIHLPIDQRPAMKDAINGIIFDYISDKGSDFHIQLLSP